MDYALGKKPARPGAVTLMFSSVFDLTVFPKPPLAYGSYELIKNWKMLANDKYGDCVFAGAAHEHMLWLREGGKTGTNFNDKTVLKDYSTLTGFNLNDVENTDNGTDMQMAANYRKKVGILDSRGRRHRDDAYVALRSYQINLACYLLGAVGVGFRFPDHWMADFDNKVPWGYKKDSTQVGGHYVPFVGRAQNGNFVCITWGRYQEVTQEAVMEYSDEAIAYLNMTRIKNELDPHGIDVTLLRKYIANPRA